VKLVKNLNSFIWWCVTIASSNLHSWNSEYEKRW